MIKRELFDPYLIICDNGIHILIGFNNGDPRNLPLTNELNVPSSLSGELKVFVAVVLVQVNTQHSI